jgi:hypothetical protein
MVILGLAFAAPAAADAPSAVPGSTQASVTVNGDGTRTLTVQGQWTWPSRTTDCNLNRAGAGFAVDWNDPAQPGNELTTLNGVTLTVGALASSALNPADNLVHGTSPAQESSDYTQWRGGCGTFNTPPGYNSGSWGPISHTYPVSFTGAIAVCPIFYDVEGSSASGPSSADQIVAGGTNDNEDDSGEDNTLTPQGNECPLTTVKSTPAVAMPAPAAVTAGTPVVASASLSGGYAPGGSMSFSVYGPGDSSCHSPAVFTGSAPVTGDGTYAAPSFTPSAPGTYQWVASYSGDAANTAAASHCGDAAETVNPVPPVDPPPPAADPPTAAPAAVAPVDLTTVAQTGLSSPPPGLTAPSALRAATAVRNNPALLPQIGRSFALAPTVGSVFVSLPHSHTVRALGPGERLPLGTTIDARSGVVLLATAVDAQGHPQFATAGGGVFGLTQTGSSAMTELVLKTPGLARLCGASPSGHMAVAASTRRRRKVVNLVWSNDNHGHFSTRGQESVALVRGTSWVTAERCDGTLTGVVHGTVIVHDRRTHRSVELDAGQSYLARR